jgi:hypothetical protein
MSSFHTRTLKLSAARPGGLQLGWSLLLLAKAEIVADANKKQKVGHVLKQRGNRIAEKWVVAGGILRWKKSSTVKKSSRGNRGAEEGETEG